MKVRPARTADLHRVAQLLRASFDDALLPYMTYAQHGIETYLAVHVSRPEVFPERTHLVALDGDDRVVGYAELHDAEAGRSFLSYICVDADLRRQGVASMMLDRFLTSRTTSGVLELEVFGDNSPAFAAYRKAGFVVVDGGRTWIRRPLPPQGPGTATGRLRLPGLALSEAMHAAYGFSELPVSWRGRELRLGRIGEHVLRCFAEDVFEDDELLAEARRAVPELTEAFLVSDAPGDDLRAQGASVVARTVRMERRFAATRGGMSG